MEFHLSFLFSQSLFGTSFCMHVLSSCHKMCGTLLVPLFMSLAVSLQVSIVLNLHQLVFLTLFFSFFFFERHHYYLLAISDERDLSAVGHLRAGN